MRITNFKNQKGMRINVRLVSYGDKFGYNDCLTHKGSMLLIEFFDPSIDSPGYDYGRFVTRMTKPHFERFEVPAYLHEKENWKLTQEEKDFILNWCNSEDRTEA